MANYSSQTPIPIGDTPPYALNLAPLGNNMRAPGVIAIGSSLYVVNFWNPAPSTYGLLVSKSTDHGATWTNIDTANGPTSVSGANGGMVTLRGTIITAVFYDGDTGPPLYLYDFDTATDTWGSVYGVIGAPTIESTGEGSGLNLVYRAGTNDLLVIYSGDGGSGLWGAAYSLTSSTWGTPFDAAINITTLPGWAAAAPSIISERMTSCQDAADNLYLFFTTDFNSDPTWNVRFFFQMITPANGVPNSSGTFYLFPGEYPTNIDPSYPTGVPVIVGSNVVFPVSLFFGGSGLTFAGVYLGIGIPAISSWVEPTGSIDPGFLAPSTNTSQVAPISWFDGTVLYMLYIGYDNVFTTDVLQLRLVQCVPAGNDPNAWVWTAQTVSKITNSAYAGLPPYFYSPYVSVAGDLVQIVAMAGLSDTDSAVFWLGNGQLPIGIGANFFGTFVGIAGAEQIGGGS